MTLRGVVTAQEASTEDKLDELLSALDVDGDGVISYAEFVDALARDTVAPAAMGKRDMQSLEAMGVDAQEMLNEIVANKTMRLKGVVGIFPANRTDDGEDVEVYTDQGRGEVKAKFCMLRQQV